jgi:hypothetical protein
MGPRAELPTWTIVRRARGSHLLCQGLRRLGELIGLREAREPGRVFEKGTHGLFEPGAQVAQLPVADTPVQLDQVRVVEGDVDHTRCSPRSNAGPPREVALSEIGAASPALRGFVGRFEERLELGVEGARAKPA